MAIELDSLEQRLIGVLIEKALTVPESYPLTLNMLVAGCNQKSNRDPVMSAEDFDVEGALRSLMDRGWVTRHEPYTGRVNRYAHEARTQLGLEAEDLAILSELLCRGPQAPGALKTRASRMRHFDSPAQVEDRLREMADRPVPYVARMEKLPRERHPRWKHLLGKEGPADPAQEQASASEPSVVAPSAHPAAVPASGSRLEQRLEALEAEVVELRRRLEDLEPGL
jgi:uncharacterized protein YceH (UPF0502 family)